MRNEGIEAPVHDEGTRGYCIVFDRPEGFVKVRERAAL